MKIKAPNCIWRYLLSSKKWETCSNVCSLLRIYKHLEAPVFYRLFIFRRYLPGRIILSKITCKGKKVRSEKKRSMICNVFFCRFCISRAIFYTVVLPSCFLSMFVDQHLWNFANSACFWPLWLLTSKLHFLVNISSYVRKYLHLQSFGF